MEGDDRAVEATSGELQDGTAVLVLNDPSLEPLGSEEEQQGSSTTAE